MAYQGDLTEDQIVYFEFTTRSTSGVPTVLAGTPVISVYKDDGITQSTAGITLTVSHDGVVGKNNIKIDTSADAFYAIGADYSVVITTGTVGGASVVGEIVGTFSIENRFDEVDVTAISGDTTAANNLELQYDTTGLTGDTFPAPQSQVNSVATGGGGIKTLATAVVITTGTETSGTVVSTEELDGTLHTIDNAAGSTEFYYEFNVNSIGIGTAVIWDGFVGNNGDEVQVSYFDWTSTTFKQVGAITGQNSSTINSQNFDIPLGATDDNGDIRIQFVSTDAVDTNTDRIWLEFTSVAAQSIILANGTAQSGGSNSIQLESGDVTIDDQFRRAKVLIVSGTGVGQEVIVTSSVASTDTLTTTPTWLVNPDSTSGYVILPAQTHSTTRNGGYDGGQVFVDTVNGTAGTEIGVNGTSTNPSSNLTDAYVIAADQNLFRFNIQPGSSLTLPSDSSNKVFDGSQYGVALNSQTIEGSSFTSCNNVSGIGTGGTAPPSFFLCGIGTVTLPPCNGFQCGLFGTFTMGSAGNFTFGGSATVFNENFVLDFGAALNASQFFLRSWGGGTVEIQNAGAGTGTYIFEMYGNAEMLTINANCSDTTNIVLGGHIPLTNNSAITTITQLANIVSEADLGSGQSVGQNVLDIAGSTFSTSTDSLEAIRDRGDTAWTTGGGGGGSGLTPLAGDTAQSGTASTIVLAATEAFADDVLNGNVIKITSGTGAGQARVIISNTLVDDTCNITPNWTTNPSSDSVYEIVEGSVNLEAISLDPSVLTPLTAAQTADAMRLTPTGSVQVDSVDDKLNTIIVTQENQNPVEQTRTSDVVTIGTETGTSANTTLQDGVEWVLTSVSGGIDAQLIFNIGTDSEIPSSLHLVAFFESGKGRVLQIQAFNFNQNAFENRGGVQSDASSLKDITLGLTDSHVRRGQAGTPGVDGDVRIKFFYDLTVSGKVSAGDDWHIDVAHVNWIKSGTTLGDLLDVLNDANPQRNYTLAAITIDTENGTPGTKIGINGTAGNPSSNIVDARILADALGFNRYVLEGFITVLTLDQNYDNWQFVSVVFGGTVNGNGQSTDGSVFLNMQLAGVFVGEIDCTQCSLKGLTTEGFFQACTLPQSPSVTLTGNSNFRDCDSTLPGTGNPGIDANSVAGISLSLTKYAGGIDISNLDNAANVTVSGRGSLALTDAATTATVIVSGHIRLIGSLPTGINLTDNARIDTGQLDEAVIDNALLAINAPANFSDLSITATTGRMDVGLWQGYTMIGAAMISDDGTDSFFTAKAMENVAASGGGFVTGAYRWSTNTAVTDPGSGFIKGNNGTLASITTISISEITNNGFNAIAFIEKLDVGDSMLISREGAGSNFVQFTVSGPATDNGGWFSIAGVVADSGGTIGNNNSLEVLFAYQSDSAAVIATATWAALTASNTDAGSFGLAVGDIDTATGLIQAKTDDLTFTVANELDVNALSWQGTSTTISSTSAKPEMDMFSISDDAIAANNLELQYDTSGLIGDEFPARQDQVGALSSGAGGISTTSSAVIITTGTEVANTVTATAALDGTVHTIEDDATVTDFFYEFNVGTTGIATTTTWNGYVQANNDTVQVYGFNWTGAAFVQIGTINGANGTTVVEEIFNLAANMTDTNGDVRIRFESTDATEVSTDRILVQFTSVAAEAFFLADGTAQSGGASSIQLESGDVSINDQFRRERVLITGGTGAGQTAICTSSVASTDTLTVRPPWLVVPDSTSTYIIAPGQANTTTQDGGYLNGQVFVDTVNGVSGTNIGINGTSDNPVDNLTDAYVIADDQNIFSFNILPGSAITLPSDSSNKIFTGDQYSLVFNGQNINACNFRGASVSGIATGGSDAPNFSLCGIGTVTLPPSNGFQCGFFGVFTIGSVGNFTFGGSASVFAINPVLDFGIGNNASSFFLQSWGGGSFEIRNAGAGTGTYQFEMFGNADRLTIASSCSPTTEIAISGHIPITNNSTIPDSAINVEGNVVSIADLGSGQTIGDNISDLAGSGFITATDSNEAIRDRGDTAWLTATGFSTLIITDILTSGQALDTTLGVLDTVTTAVNITTIADPQSFDNIGQTTNLPSDVIAISGSTDAADNLEASALTIKTAAAIAGTLSTTQMSTNLTEDTDEHYNGRIIIWTSGILFQQATDITAYNGTTKILTYTGITEAPSAGDSFVIL